MVPWSPSLAVTTEEKSTDKATLAINGVKAVLKICALKVIEPIFVLLKSYNDKFFGDFTWITSKCWVFLIARKNDYWKRGSINTW